MTDLQSFYGAVYPRLVGQVTLITSNRAEAEELVQDAFIKLIPRWGQISRYEDPEAWIRRVAMRLAISRWRKARTAAAFLPRLFERKQLEGPTGGDIDLLRALSSLPLGQRQVIVLHCVMQVPISEVAAELNISEGTVKSRLSRGRAFLNAQLSPEVIS